MAAAKGNKNAEGHKPKAPYTDRKKAAQVRNGLLDIAIKTLNGNDEAKKWELLLRMSGSLLPKLQEITGEDGKDLPTPIYGGRSAETI